MTQAAETPAPAVVKIGPEHILTLPGIEVILNRRKSEITWQSPERKAMHFDLPVALAVAQGLMMACVWGKHGDVVRIERSEGYATMVRLVSLDHGECTEDAVTVQTIGPHTGPLYAFDDIEAHRVAVAMIFGARCLGGYR